MRQTEIEMIMRTLSSQSQRLTSVVSIGIDQRVSELLSLAETQGLSDVIHWHCVSEFRKDPKEVTEAELGVLLEKFIPLFSELALQELENGRTQ